MTAPAPVRSAQGTPVPPGRSAGSTAVAASPPGAATTSSRRRITPLSLRRLRRLQLGAVALLLAFGAFVLTALGVSLTAATSAAETLTQYHRLADARVQALEVQQSANAWALTPTSAVRADLDQRLSTLAASIADAAGVSADRDRLVPLTGAVVSYGMTLQNALNADGEASAAVLARANTQLSEQVITPLEAAGTAAGDRLAPDLSANWFYWVLGGAVLTFAGLVAIAVALAKASHRYLNLGVAAGVLCALISAVTPAVLASGATTVASDFTATERARLDAVTTARQQLAQARADELLSIGLRSAGGTYANRWTSGYNAAKSALAEVPKSSTASAKLSQYNTAHTAVATELKASNWSGAATKALAAGDESGAYTALDAALTTLADTTRSPVTASVDGVRSSKIGGIAGVVLFTLTGAGLAYWGVARRIEEYR